MKFIIIFLISAIILFNSCTKYEGSNSLLNQTRPPVVNMTPGSLKGREFVFDSLEWIDDDFGYPIFYMVDSNLFMPGRFLSVAIKHDTLNVWEQVYRYSLWVGILYVLPDSASPPLIGKGFSLKVKFL